jgi:hypothetical protein
MQTSMKATVFVVVFAGLVVRARCPSPRPGCAVPIATASRTGSRDERRRMAAPGREFETCMSGLSTRRSPFASPDMTTVAFGHSPRPANAHQEVGGCDASALSRWRATAHRPLALCGTGEIPEGAKDTKLRRPEIFWKQIAGMRDKVIHDYFGVNFEIVWAVVQKDLPKLSVAVMLF